MTVADVMNHKIANAQTVLHTRFGKSACGSSVLLLDHCRFFSFLLLYTVGGTPWVGDQPVAKAATYTQNKRTQTSMPPVRFKPTIPGFE
jgi:hypothetical protein